MKHNTFTLIAFLLGLAIFGCKKPEQETITPKITNDKVEATATIAIFTWTVDWPGKLISVVEVSENEDMSHSQIYGSETETENHNFTVTVRDLKVATKYYYRYLVWNKYYENNRFEFEVKSFSTFYAPRINTNKVDDIGWRIASVEIITTDDGGDVDTECGICWNTDGNPSIEDNHTCAGYGKGTFLVKLSELSPGTTYHVRAYAINSVSIVYGEELEFSTVSPLSYPDGILPGVFSVNQNSKIRFSQGNLQYQASTNTWRFAENQWNIVGSQNPEYGEPCGNVIGSDNKLISDYYDGWIDLFGWGTSGWDNGNVYYHPYDYERMAYGNDEFGYGYGPTDGTVYTYDLTDNYANADWGLYNSINNGGNTPGLWRTLTRNEWLYLFNSRTTNSGILFAKAQIEGVNGIVLLPDNWDAHAFSLNEANSFNSNFSSNNLNALQWNTMEKEGAVFLPAAGSRTYYNTIELSLYHYHTQEEHIPTIWNYWSTTGHYAYQAWFFDIDNGWMLSRERYDGLSVRLVAPAN